MYLLRTVGRLESAEVMALHYALKAFALGASGDFHLLAGSKDIHGQLLTDFIFIYILDAELAHVAEGSLAGLVLMTFGRACLPYALQWDQIPLATPYIRLFPRP